MSLVCEEQLLVLLKYCARKEVIARGGSVLGKNTSLTRDREIALSIVGFCFLVFFNKHIW